MKSECSSLTVTCGTHESFVGRSISYNLPCHAGFWGRIILVPTPRYGYIYFDKVISISWFFAYVIEEKWINIFLSETGFYIFFVLISMNKYKKDVFLKLLARIMSETFSVAPTLFVTGFITTGRISWEHIMRTNILYRYIHRSWYVYVFRTKKFD